MLDQSPLNELGRHLLDPADEQRWLDAGIVFARRVVIDGQSFTLTTKLTLAELSAIKNRQENNTLVRKGLQLTNVNSEATTNY